MRKSGFIFLFTTFSLVAAAQVTFKTLLKPGPVVAGEAFQVQYVLEETDPAHTVYPPDFGDFRLVNGPYEYEGYVQGTGQSKKLKNIVYTLEAVKPGTFRINGASIRINDHFIKSNDVWLEVISPAEATARGLTGGDPGRQPTSFLAPGENPYQKIRANLFLKVGVDKKKCFVGEAVTATFKLYSRLMSRSDIVKNPGFYGFTVQDMISLGDKQSAVEVVNGKQFDVHTIRKVQLYPLRAGVFTIDPMEVVNEVSFSKSRVNKRNEQEIVEGVFPEEEKAVPANTVVYKSSMSTPEVVITVRAAPVDNKPADFTGATGNFLISSVVNTTRLSKNEKGELLVRVSGKGNFTQLPAPLIQWPHGIEGFEPEIKDKLDITRSPLAGERVFRYVFVSANAGQYTLPAMGFSFFDPDSNDYKTVSTKKIAVTIDDTEKMAVVLPARPDSREDSNPVFLLLVGSLVFIVVAVWMLWFRKRRQYAVSSGLQRETVRPAIEEILKPASMALQAPDKVFYARLRQCIWDVFAVHFGLTGSKMSRQEVLLAMQQKQVDEVSRQVILDALQQCETGIFTDAAMGIDKKELLAKTSAALAVIYEA